MKTRPLIIPLLTLTCGSPTASLDAILQAGTGTQPGILEMYGEPIQIEGPSEAMIGVPFRVTVRTYGGGCMAQGETRTVVAGRSAVIAPFDTVLTPRLQTICPAYLTRYDHVADLVFSESGTAFYTVRGRRIPENEPMERVFAIRIR